MNRFCIFTKRWCSKPQASIPYVSWDWTILKYNVRSMCTGKNLFNLLSMPENFVSLFAMVSMWCFQNICSLRINPRKLKFSTLSIAILFICRSGTNSSISLLMAWNTTNFVFLTFNDNLLTASQSKIFANWLFMSRGAPTEIWIVLKSVVSSAYSIYLKASLAFGMSFMYIKNRSGPNIDPCGSPVERGSKSEDTPSSSIYCCLPVR